MILRYHQFINEGYNSDVEISFDSPPVFFGIKYYEFDEIMYEITDEFQELDYSLDNSLNSSIILRDRNSFVVTLYNKNIDFPSQLPVLHYLEPKIFDLIGHVNDKLGMYDLEVYFSDFGEHDAYYEIVITKKGNKPPVNPQRYIIDENGDLQYKN